MTAGERRLTERLEHKLDDDTLLWWDVPIGPKQTRPDFVVLHPRRGALILETKDWHVQTIRRATRECFDIQDSHSGYIKPVKNPLQQARHCAIQVVNALERDAPLRQTSGPHQGKLCIPWAHGVVFTRITRKQFEQAGLDSVISAHLVICQDEMYESVDAHSFQARLWAMFPHDFGQGSLTEEQLARVRWILFPELRIPTQGELFTHTEAPAYAGQEDELLPDIMRVMDLQQEQLARSLGDGHRVIHGVAGSGKTMILGYRAEYLAQTLGEGSKPILVLCYNEPLAVQLAATMRAKGIGPQQVQCIHWDKWTRSQLVQHRQPLPPPPPPPQTPLDQLFAEYTRRLIDAVAQGHIPSGQYHAILIDEGHDFAPEWLQLLGQMVDPHTNSLLLLYDDAQSIYRRGQRLGFSLKSAGIQAQGRTTVLKINYRNTKQILQLAHRMAGNLLRAQDAPDEDHIPLVAPISCGREGPVPIVIDLPTLPERAAKIAELLADQHAQGHAWSDMAVLCRDKRGIGLCSDALSRKGLPYSVRHRPGDFNPEADTIKVMTMHVCKGLEWPVVAVLRSEVRAKDKEELEMEAKLAYVAATRAIYKLLK